MTFIIHKAIGGTFHYKQTSIIIKLHLYKQMITLCPKATERLERRISAGNAEFWPHSRGAGV